MDVEEKMRQHSDSIRNKRHSGFLKLVKKRTGNQPVMNNYDDLISNHDKGGVDSG